MPDIRTQNQFRLTHFPLPYKQERDYFRSALNVLHREGFRFSAGIAGEVRGEIPINAGASSSSALLVSWLSVLSQLADEPQKLSASRLAELAYVAEVLEFSEPGGMMDHYATAVGHVIYLESKPAIRLQALRPALGTFVLGDSCEPKDTIGILARVKHGMLRIVRQLIKLNPAFSLHATYITEVSEYRDVLPKDDYILLKGTLANRDILRDSLALLQHTGTASGGLDHQRLGQLLTNHQTNLRDAQRISTPKINRMIDAALTAGAVGAKINGSGGGGCMFAYAPVDPEAVADAIKREGGRAYIVSVDSGTANLPISPTVNKPVIQIA